MSDNQPVAWRYRWRDGGDWKLSFHFDDGLDPAKYEQEPLFTRPSEQAVTDEMVDKAVVEAIHALRVEQPGRAYDILKAAMEAGRHG